jgi:hypothetical protein
VRRSCRRVHGGGAPAEASPALSIRGCTRTHEHIGPCPASRLEQGCRAQGRRWGGAEEEDARGRMPPWLVRRRVVADDCWVGEADNCLVVRKENLAL